MKWISRDASDVVMGVRIPPGVPDYKFVAIGKKFVIFGSKGFESIH